MSYIMWPCFHFHHFFHVGHDNKQEPEYQNQDEIDRVGPTPSRIPKVNRPVVPEALLINTSTEPEEVEYKSSLSPRAQVELVNAQVSNCFISISPS